MVPIHASDLSYDPVGMLDEILERAWGSLCQMYEVNAELPEVQDLFCGEGYSSPDRAAEAVLANMLMEIMGSVGRFSPWYRLPARAYGLTSVRDTTNDRTHWMLAPEALRKWEGILRPLSLAIEKNSGLIQAMVLVEGLVARNTAEEACVTARCNCYPPRSIHLERTLFDSAEIICNLCRQPFFGE